jgi:hypothetical protein
MEAFQGGLTLKKRAALIQRNRPPNDEATPLSGLLHFLITIARFAESYLELKQS